MTSIRGFVARGALLWRALAALLLLLGGVASAFSIARAQDAAPEARLTALDADEAHKPVTQEARDRARAAIEKSKRFRAGGDESHAKLSDRVAISWLAAAEDLARTADAEGKAADARRAALDAGAEAERERALLEETMLQNGRLRAEVDEAERNAKNPPDAAAPKPPKATRDGGAR